MSGAAETEPDRATVERAAVWHALLREGDATDGERVACASWRAENAAHEMAWQRLCQLWGDFEPGRADAARTAIAAGLSTRKRRRTRAAAIATAVVLFACGCGIALQQRGMFADYRAGAAPQTFTLVDGSRITLDSGSAADVNFDKGRRRIDLRRGEMLVDVARDPLRPFTVITPQGSARALGTRFLVSPRASAGDTARAEDMRVTVLESVVRACADHRTVTCVDLHPGEQAVLSGGGIGAVQNVDAQAAAAWVQRRLVVDDVTLVDVLQTLRRHRTGFIDFDADTLRDVHVSGVFPLDDTDRTLDVLASTAPVAVERHTAWFVVVKKRAPAPAR